MNDKNDDPIGNIPIAGESAPAEQPRQTGPAGTTGATSGQPVAREAAPPAAGSKPPRRRQRQRLSSALLGAGLAAGLALVLYLLGSLILFPLIAPRLMAQSLEKKLARPVTIARAEWRPLTRRLILHNGIIGPRQADPYDRVDPLLFFRTMTVEVRFSALLRRSPLFSAMLIEQGYAHLVREEDKSYNFSTPAGLTASRLFPGRLEIRNSRLEYTDHGHAPVFNGELIAFTGTLWQEPGKTGDRGFSLSGQGPEESRLELAGSWQSGDQPVATATLELHELPLTALAAYLEPLLGSNISQGKLRGRSEFVRRGDRLSVNQRFIISSLRLGEPAREQQALPLLQALLTDRQQQFPLQLAASFNRHRRDAPYLGELAAAINEMRDSAATNPMALLARGLPELEITGQIRFAAGSSTLSREGGRALDQLAAALARRPLLTLGLQGISDPACDREALRTEMEQAVHRQRRQAVAALARRLAGGGEPEAPELSPPPPDPGSLQPGTITVEQSQLLELAAQRQETVRQRLHAALEPGHEQRLTTLPPKLSSPPAPGEQTCNATVSVKPGYQENQQPADY